MNPVESIVKSRAVPMQLRVGVVSHLIMGVEFGRVTIIFEHGRPTRVERCENIRIGEEGASAVG